MRLTTLPKHQPPNNPPVRARRDKYLSALRDVLRRRSRKLVVKLFGVPVCRTCFDLEQACLSRCGAPEAERVEAFLEGGPYIFK